MTEVHPETKTPVDEEVKRPSSLAVPVAVVVALFTAASFALNVVALTQSQGMAKSFGAFDADTVSYGGTSYVEGRLEFFTRTAKMRWLNFKVLELATRAIQEPKIFKHDYQSRVADLKLTLDNLNAFSPPATQELFKEIREKMQGRLATDEKAIDTTVCHGWTLPNCEVNVPGVASNADMTFELTPEGEQGCKDLDSTAGTDGMCEWMLRPDEVPEPQPPNLLNKCVCYACRGPLPDESGGFKLPDEYVGIGRGTDAKYQCQNDPTYSTTCEWDGYACVSKSATPNPDLMNTTSGGYVDTFMELEQKADEAYSAIYNSMMTDVLDAHSFTQTAGILSLACIAACVALPLLAAVMPPAGKHDGLASWLHKQPKGISLVFVGSAILMNAFSVYVMFGMLGAQSDLANTELWSLDKSWQTLHYDAILTGSASRFVMTADGTGWLDGDTSDEALAAGCDGGGGCPWVYDFWFIKYITEVVNLDSAINAMLEGPKGTATFVGDGFKTIDFVNKALVDMEQIALCSCEPPDASGWPAGATPYNGATADTSMGRDVLYSGTYLHSKAIFNDAVARVLQRQETDTYAQAKYIEVSSGEKRTIMFEIAVTLLAHCAYSYWAMSKRANEKQQLAAENERLRAGTKANTDGVVWS